MRIRYEKAREEYRNSEDYKCNCPRCLSHKEPISRIDTKQEEYSYFFGLFSGTKKVETVIDKCIDCGHEFTEKDIVSKQSEFWGNYLDKHLKYEFKMIPTSLGYEYNGEIIHIE